MACLRFSKQLTNVYILVFSFGESFIIKWNVKVRFTSSTIVTPVDNLSMIFNFSGSNLPASISSWVTFESKTRFAEIKLTRWSLRRKRSSLVQTGYFRI